MGNVFRRFTGRSWRLRQQSMSLWPHWIKQLSTKEQTLHFKTPLIQLANSEIEAHLMQKLCNERSHLNLKMLSKEEIEHLEAFNPLIKHGGLISYNDGRIDPISLQKCLYKACLEKKTQFIDQSVVYIERTSLGKDNKWRIHLANGESFIKNTIILCAALASEQLLKPLGHQCPIEPVLGQALRISIQATQKNYSHWPAVINSHGINMIPLTRNQMMIGATLEPGVNASLQSLENMKNLNGYAPDWLQKSQICKHWHGIRAKPLNRPAPILEKLEPGLFLMTAHYRNGILLAPASAEWIANQINIE